MFLITFTSGLADATDNTLDLADLLYNYMIIGISVICNVLVYMLWEGAIFELFNLPSYPFGSNRF